jgi:hypothetical protein
LFLAVTASAAALGFVCRIRHDRALTTVNFLLALFAAMLVALELVTRAQKHHAIRADLLVTSPLLCVAVLVVGLCTSRSISGVGRVIALSMAVTSGATLAWSGWWFVRFMSQATSQAEELMRRDDEGSRMYWEETIRCQGAMSTRFGVFERKENACSGNLRVKSRVGQYPFTRVVVNDASEVYLLAALQPGAEVVFQRPMRGRFDPSTRRLTASDWDGASKLEVELLAREEGSCEARIDRVGYGRDVLRLEREELRACTAEENAPVQFVGAWSKIEQFGSENRHLDQIWLWRSRDTAWGLVFKSDGVRGVEKGNNSLERYRGKALGSNEYELLPYSKRGGPGAQDISVSGLHISVSDKGARIKHLWGGVPDLLDGGEMISHPKIRLVPIRDSDRFAAYFDTVLESVDVLWTPR